MEKAGVVYFSSGTSPSIDNAVINQFAEDTKAETKVAQFFREIPVNAGASVMPFAPEAGVLLLVVKVFQKLMQLTKIS